MYRLATAPRGIGQVLDSVFQLTGATFTAQLPFSIISGLVGILPLAYMIWAGALNDPAQMLALGTSPAYWISILVMIPLMMIVYGAALLRGEGIAQGQPVGIGESFGRAAGHIVAIVVAVICFMLALAIGFVLLIIPGLILMVTLYMFLPAIVLDGKGPVESLKYSHGLVWGNWWRTATVVTIAFVILYVLLLLFSFALGMIFAFTGFDPVMLFLVQGGTSFLSSLVVMPFFCALYLEVYRDLKMRKTGGDLAARIEAVGAPR